MIIQKGGVARHGGNAAPDELKAINAFAKTALTAEEVYTFSVLLCDNEVDRDFERFTEGTLKELQTLFVGKTGISDHEWSSGRQVARIYRTELVTEPGKKTSLGTPYMYLRGYAYMLRTEENSALIADIEGGIKRETSVGCAVGETRCSICGEVLGGGKCSHRKGETYGGKLCCGELVKPYDAYEWSFVAVPSQRQAGVTKSLKRKEVTMEEIMKRLEKQGGLNLSDGEREKLCAYIKNLKSSAKDGVYYRDSLSAEVLRLSAAVQPEVSRETMDCIAKSLSVAQLDELKRAFEKKLGNSVMPKPQLYTSKSKKDSQSNREFSI